MFARLRRWAGEIGDRARAGGKIVVPHLETYVTHRCNLTCESCLHYSNHGHAGDLSVDELRRSMSLWNGRLLPKTFALLGGEPGLHRDLPALVYLAREMWPHPMTRTEVVTNGLLLQRHPDLPRALADTRTVLCISIHSDGPVSPRYRDKLAPELALLAQWKRDFGIRVEELPCMTWERGYRGVGDGMLPFEDGDAGGSWDNCVTGQQRFQLFQDGLWKCAPLAYLPLQACRFRLSAK